MNIKTEAFTMIDDNLDYLLVLENETDVIGEKILRGFNVNFDELGNIIRHNHGQTYIQMSRPRSVTNKGSKQNDWEIYNDQL